MAQKSWSEYSPLARKLIFVAGVVQVLLFIAAQVDLSRRPAEQIVGSKKRWRILSFLNFVGPALYFWRGRQKPSIG